MKRAVLAWGHLVLVIGALTGHGEALPTPSLRDYTEVASIVESDPLDITPGLSANAYVGRFGPISPFLASMTTGATSLAPHVDVNSIPILAMQPGLSEAAKVSLPGGVRNPSVRLNTERHALPGPISLLAVGTGLIGLGLLSRKTLHKLLA